MRAAVAIQPEERRGAQTARRVDEHPAPARRNEIGLARRERGVAGTRAPRLRPRAGNALIGSPSGAAPSVRAARAVRCRSRHRVGRTGGHVELRQQLRRQRARRRVVEHERAAREPDLLLQAARRGRPSSASPRPARRSCGRPARWRRCRSPSCRPPRAARAPASAASRAAGSSIAQARDPRRAADRRGGRGGRRRRAGERREHRPRATGFVHRPEPSQSMSATIDLRRAAARARRRAPPAPPPARARGCRCARTRPGARRWPCRRRATGPS